jgi:hypothetical protein
MADGATARRGTGQVVLVVAGVRRGSIQGFCVHLGEMQRVRDREQVHRTHVFIMPLWLLSAEETEGTKVQSGAQ